MKPQNVIHQLTSQSHSQMMSYVIKTKDGKIIVIDGGTNHDASYLLDYIGNLTGGKVSINAWILTHIHNDHVGAIMECYRNHSDKFTVDAVYYNFPPAELVDTCEGEHGQSDFFNFTHHFADITHTLKENDTLDFGEIKFKVLYTADFTITTNFINNTSTVLKMFADGQTMIFLGDLGIEGGNLLLEWHYDETQSDFVEMAHHGQNGVTFDVYKAINPKVCFWDTPLWLWNNDAGKGYNTHNWQTVIVQGWMNELGVKHHFVTKDGTNVVELPYEN